MPGVPTQFAVFLDVETAGLFVFTMDPKWPVVELALRGMNGKTNSMVVIEGLPPMHMTVGGGGPEGFILSLTYDGEVHHLLHNPTGNRDLVEMKIGGTPGQYPKMTLVPLDMVLAAAKPFVATGIANPALPWVSTNDIPLPNAPVKAGKAH
jgi:hypothetical protein